MYTLLDLSETSEKILCDIETVSTDLIYQGIWIIFLAFVMFYNINSVPEKVC
jgi:hypothetical protein